MMETRFTLLEVRVGFLHGVLKCLVMLQGWVLHIKTEKKILFNMFPELSGFWVCCKITFKNKCCHCVISHIQLTQCTCSIFFHFCKCWARMVCQVTVHNQCPKCPPPETMHASTLKITDCRTIFYSSRNGCEWFDRHKNCFFLSVCSFSFGAKCTMVFKYLYWQKSKELGCTLKAKRLLPTVVTQEWHVLSNICILDVPRVLWHGLGLYRRGTILCRLWHPDQPLWDLW
jgi:hypothetical protein